MKKLILLFILFVTGCDNSTEPKDCGGDIGQNVELWDICYNIAATDSLIGADLILNETQRTGPIPPEIGQLTNLVYIKLIKKFSGSIPPEIGQLTNLTYLNLASNDLSGPIPKEIGQLTNLTYLNLGYNDLSGPIPKEIGELINFGNMLV